MTKCENYETSSSVFYRLMEYFAVFNVLYLISYKMSCRHNLIFSFCCKHNFFRVKNFHLLSAVAYIEIQLQYSENRNAQQDIPKNTR